MTPWHVLLGVLLVCGAVVPGPCSFNPQREWDCSLADACPERFACAHDGYCKSADIACTDDEERCTVPGLRRVGLCVPKEELQSSKVHCGGCFARCKGVGVCTDGVCQGAPEDGHCSRARGHFDCPTGDACVDDGDGDDDGICKDGAAGTRKTLAACSKDSQCEGGLCSEGLCTRPCDFGCPRGTSCADDAIPGGLCVPDDGEQCP